ncbi:MAG TPA: pentose kinase, partial [Propionibacteriaceae bacterium]|nr:pentose kinase [Propionibacteriaceae bacterium]
QRLGAGWATEPSDASAMNLMDTRTDSWSAPLIAATGASLGLFAPIVASAAITGTVQQLP